VDQGINHFTYGDQNPFLSYYEDIALRKVLGLQDINVGKINPFKSFNGKPSHQAFQGMAMA
jgi:hypothetical protein